MDIKVLEKEEAKKLGLKKYFTGKPCKYGHLSERYVIDTRCIECRLRTVIPYREAHREDRKEYDKNRPKRPYVYKSQAGKILTSEQRKRKNELWRIYAKNNRGSRNANESKRRASLLQRTPVWADLSSIKEIYKRCYEISKETGIEHHVDHIIPLINDLVCGLHVSNNLRIITKSENLAKSNSFDVT